MPSKVEPIAVVVLAAGLGKRMNSELPKVPHTVRSKPMVLRVMDALTPLKPDRVITVIGHRGSLVSSCIEAACSPTLPLRFSNQAEMRGTGDALKAALPELKDFTGTVLILCGDIPLIRGDTLMNLVAEHRRTKATLSLLSVDLPQPGLYGRIIRQNVNGPILKITEAKDCSADQLRIQEINVGVYAVDSAFLGPAVTQLTSKNQQSEYYLTDIVERASKEGQTIHNIKLTDPGEALGVNTKLDLSMVEEVLRQREIDRLLESGVTIVDRSSVFIDECAEIESGVLIGPNTQIFGSTKLCSGVQIEGTAYIVDSLIGKDTLIKLGVRIQASRIGDHCSVGPFANLREGTVLDDHVRLGNFVETKKAHLHEGAKAPHLSYVGDAIIGKHANLGAGTITCNYDGYNKSVTEVGEHAFVGSNTALVAPVKIGAGAVIGAGSTITKDVEQDALSFTRSAQLSKRGWAKTRRLKSGEKKDDTK